MKENDIYKILKIDLEKNGWIIWKSPSFKKMRWDIFGVFDLICVSNKEIFCENNEIRFIQFTSLPNLSARRNKIKEFLKKNKIFLNNCYIYAYDKKKSIFRIEKIDY